MTAVATARSHTTAAIKLLEDLASVTNARIMVGRGGQPAGSGWQGEPERSEFRPYVVIYPMTGTVDGPLAEPVIYLDYRAQATCVSSTQEGAEAVSDFVKTAWVNVPLVVSGRTSYRGQVYIESIVIRDDAVSPPVHYTTIQVSWRTQAN